NRIKRRAPDVFVMDDPPRPLPNCFETWRPGHSPPRIAFEFVSQEWKKDYYEILGDYDQLGVEELVIFDRRAAVQQELDGLSAHDHALRQPIQLFARDASGLLTRAYAGQRPVFSRVLGAWLVVTTTDHGPTLGLATDPEGE